MCGSAVQMKHIVEFAWEQCLRVDQQKYQQLIVAGDVILSEILLGCKASEGRIILKPTCYNLTLYVQCQFCLFIL